METISQMATNFSEGLYTMWVVNVLIGAYAIFVLSRFVNFIVQHINKLGTERDISRRIIQAFSGVFIIFMFIGADIWAMFYYTQHPLSPLEFFFYAFDVAVLRHMCDEVTRFHEQTK